jgi:hypothetical protein
VQPFTGFVTDRLYASFTRFYADHASPVIVDIPRAGSDLHRI